MVLFPTVTGFNDCLPAYTRKVIHSLFSIPLALASDLRNRSQPPPRCWTETNKGDIFYILLCDTFRILYYRPIESSDMQPKWGQLLVLVDTACPVQCSAERERQFDAQCVVRCYLVNDQWIIMFVRAITVAEPFSMHVWARGEEWG